MAFNTYKAYVRFTAASFNASDPTGVDIARILCNDAQYFADAAAQSRVKWIATAAGAERVPDGTVAVDNYYRIGAVSQRILCHLHPYDGAFRFRVRLAGRSTQGDEVKFRLVITTPDNVEFGIENYSATLAYAAEYVTSSTSSAWLAETNSKTLLTVSEDFARAGLSRYPSITSTSTSTPTVNVDSCEMLVEVWGRTEDVTSAPSLAGLLVEEYIGT